MRVMVFDVSAESGGALSVLYDFYNQYKRNRDHEYIFVVSKPRLQETTNIKVLRYPWIKKSWFHRLFFDHLIAPHLIKKYHANEALSLQNIIIPHTQVYQSVYVHNALPFSEYRFSIFKDTKLWVYQNIIGRSIFHSIKKADSVIVQTAWMKKKCIEQLQVDENKITVSPLIVEQETKKRFIDTAESRAAFFYPASGVVFKNHKIIIDACIRLKGQGFHDYNVIFTLNGDENKHILQLYRQVKAQDFPVRFVGLLSRDDVFQYYTESVLVFPSYIETVGLPLLEARSCGTPIIAADCQYARDALSGYDFVTYFAATDGNGLADIMLQICTKLRHEDGKDDAK